MPCNTSWNIQPTTTDRWSCGTFSFLWERVENLLLVLKVRKRYYIVLSVHEWRCSWTSQDITLSAKWRRSCRRYWLLRSWGECGWHGRFESWHEIRTFNLSKWLSTTNENDNEWCTIELVFVMGVFPRLRLSISFLRDWISLEYSPSTHRYCVCCCNCSLRCSAYRRLWFSWN